jgi:hypothetical protein
MAGFIIAEGNTFKAFLDETVNKVSVWLREQTPLFEAFCIALSLHVIALPVIWFLGWALPWPKAPTVTTVVEYDLGNWPNVAKPKKIFDIRDPVKDPI